MKATQWLHDNGQSVWLDHITRTLLDSGTLKQYILDRVYNHGARPQRLSWASTGTKVRQPRIFFMWKRWLRPLP